MAFFWQNPVASLNPIRTRSGFVVKKHGDLWLVTDADGFVYGRHRSEAKANRHALDLESGYRWGMSQAGRDVGAAVR